LLAPQALLERAGSLARSVKPVPLVPRVRLACKVCRASKVKPARPARPEHLARQVARVFRAQLALLGPPVSLGLPVRREPREQPAQLAPKA
jgi:hypothetical protein